MPIMLTPEPGAVLGTKRVSMPEWYTDGSQAEWIEILTFLRQETLDRARAASIRQIRENGRTRDDLNMPIYFTTLLEAQVKGWRLFGPDGQEIPFSQENLARLPWGVVGWLHEQVLHCNGTLPTRDMSVQTASGQSLDYFRQDDGVGAGEAPAVSDPV